MSMAELQRLKALEAESFVLKARLDKLETIVFGVEANDALDDFEHDTAPAPRKRRNKEAA
jgi:hypothetical protein